MTMDRVPSAVAAAIVLVVGLIEAMMSPGLSDGLAPTLIVIGTAVAVGIARRMPAVALLLLWGVCLAQLFRGSELMLVQISIVYVAFAVARWGSRAALWLSALSIPVAAALLLVMIGRNGFGGLHVFGGGQIMSTAFGYDARPALVFLIGAAALSAPWLAGLAFRFGVDSRRSLALRREAEANTAKADRELAQTREIVRLREGQAQLANDVHDVVGHSLAVILAQAESAQYLDRTDPEMLRETMTKIATAARASLRDVRQVLSATAGQNSGPNPGGSADAAARHGDPASSAVPSSALTAELDRLVDSVRESGHRVDSSTRGEQRPLAPELETVAFRVLQEMLTNAIRHGSREQPIVVERQWGDGLRLSVRNTAAAGAGTDADGGCGADGDAGGLGIEGMRRRLQSVGGTLEIRRGRGGVGQTVETAEAGADDDDASAVFTATALIPYRARVS